MKPIISIIIPVYNAEKYLAECLHSVVQQSFQDIEIILVNDASTDGSNRILAEFQQRDPRIRVIDHPKNLGIGGARNSGLELATGKYILFVDSDDTIEPQTCYLLYDTAIKHSADIVGCAFRRTDEQNQRTLQIDFCSKKKELIFHKEEVYNAYFGGKISVTVQAKLYKSSIWQEDNLRMPLYMVNEDNYIFWDVGERCDTFIQLKDILYYHRQHSKSVTGRSISHKFIDDLYAALQRQKECFAAGHYRQSTLANSQRRLQHSIRSEILESIGKDNQSQAAEIATYSLQRAAHYGLQDEVFQEFAHSWHLSLTELSRQGAADWWYQFGQASWLQRLKMVAKKILNRP